MPPLLKRAARGALRLAGGASPALAARLANLLRSSADFSAGSRSRLEYLAAFALSQLPTVPHHKTREKVLRTLRDEHLITESGLDGYLKRLYGSRQMDLFEQAAFDESLGHDDLRRFYQVRLSHYRGTSLLSREEMQALYERGRRGSRSQAILNLALEHAVRSEDEEFAATLLADATENGSALSHVALSGAIRLLLKKDKTAEARRYLKDHLARAPEKTRLSFLELAHRALSPSDREELHLPDCRSWRMLLPVAERLLEIQGEAPAAEFRRLFLQPLASLPGDRDLMNIRFDAGEKERLLQLIEGAVSKRVPLSLIRLGDGESYAFSHAPAGVPAGTLAEDNLARELHWWGKQPPSTIREDIRRQVREAAAGADILGLPTIHRVIRDTDLDLNRLSARKSPRGLAVLFHALGREIPADRTVFTEERCHQVVFDEEQLVSTMRLAERCVIIGCWSREQLKVDLPDSVRVILVAPPVKVQAEAAGGGPPLFSSYGSVLSQIDEHCGPGALVLVAAGIIGKIFIHRAKKRGAVALDIGAVLDYLAGYKTRSILDVV